MGDYQGDHAAIKVALNGTLDALAGYVEEIAQVLTEMANSNLDVAITGDYRGDFAPIKQALNLIVDSFNELLSEMNSAAEQVAAGSRQVSDGSQALSQGTTEQASSIEQLNASITEIAAQTKQNAINANEANDLAGKARGNAVEGNGQMKHMVRAMSEINESSTNISKIIKVIDEIAFQTNILALNAAVEAARAGQHGKGFAVVAEEVRNLAARSANAAKETTALIEGSIQKVSAGTRIADDTAKALDQIVNDVSRAADLVGAIAVASNEQATGIAQVNQGVEQVSSVVQANSATSEESAATSEELSSQADLLKNLISRFRLRKAGQFPGHRMSESDARAVDLHLKKHAAPAVGHDQPVAGQRQKMRINLNDIEFGKY
jgi:methyl-accepting chemotaxis protein